MGLQLLIPDPFVLGFEVDRIGRERYATIELWETAQDVAILGVMFFQRDYCSGFALSGSARESESEN